MIDKHPDRLIGFAGIDVPAIDAIQQLEYAIGSLELEGVKLVPPVQKFDIADMQFTPFFQKLLEYKIPLWTHTGHQVSTVGSIARYGHPQLIDELALRFPELVIIMGHMGVPWFWDAFSVVQRHPNVYIDISAHPHFFPYFPFDLFTAYSIEDKVLFASDHPLSPWSEHISAVKALPISKTFEEKLMGKNASKILRIG
jgi:predicted TIM-barrel fold metal-dependent hydrolase